ncbi:MAG: DUF1800 domain-containing protein [bacterium]|nr:DUF1800 domain-containing protein [bacterium]
MGQELFQPPNVKGWDGGATWITTATLFTRYNFAAGLLAGTNDREFERRQRRWKMNFDALADVDKRLDDYPGLSIPPVQVPLVRQPLYDPSVILGEAGLTGPRTGPDVLVDYFVDRLLQMPITLKQRAALREIVGGSRTIGPTAPNGIDRIRRLIAAVMSMPEYQVN